MWTLVGLSRRLESIAVPLSECGWRNGDVGDSYRVMDVCWFEVLRLAMATGMHCDSGKSQVSVSGGTPLP